MFERDLENQFSGVFIQKALFVVGQRMKKKRKKAAVGSDSDIVPIVWK